MKTKPETRVYRIKDKNLARLLEWFYLTREVGRKILRAIMH